MDSLHSPAAPRAEPPANTAATSPDSATRNAQARVTVGLPVYNGERFLEQTLQSILAQTYADFELLISDNASSDATPEIARDFSRRDRRVRYSRNDVNIGADRNYNRCIELARGDYFWGIGYDDLADSTYLERCTAILEGHPSIALCHTRMFRIDGSGQIIGEFEGHEFSAAPSPHERFADAIRAPWTIVCHGVLRMSTLRKTRLLIAHPASDSVLQAELALHGKLHEIPELLFFHRVPSGAPLSSRDRVGWSEPAKEGAIIFPHWRRLGELFRSVARTPLRSMDALRCLSVIARYTLSRRMIAHLPRDVRIAAGRFLSRSPAVRRLREARRVRRAQRESARDRDRTT